MTIENHESPRSLVDCNIVVNKFDIQSRNDVHFRTNTIRKIMNPLSSVLYSSTRMGLALNNM